MEATDREYGHRLAHPEPGERVVISGLSGKYPDSDNTQLFQEHLFNKVDLVSDDTRRWDHIHNEIPQRSGKLNDINKLDIGFFGIPQKYADYSDPMNRMILEKAVEAVIDAGVNPAELEGTNTAVIVGICSSETERKLFYELQLERVGGVLGCLRSVSAQRISYYLKLNGQAFTTDTACSSSTYAMNIAYESIRNGLCDQAIVGGVNVCLSPYFSLQFSRLGMLSIEGKCRAFDNDANGYVRAEAACAVFLQKEKHARRIYTKLVHSKLNCDGYKSEGITFPASKVQKKLLEDFYDECNVVPTSISFVEAHGTGTKVGDPEELLAIDEIFCKDRQDTLLIGSVKSNIGHTEPASFLCSVTKVIYAMETNYIPPNMHFKTPRLDSNALMAGRIKVVTEKTKWENHNGLVAINNFGFGGANGHILLQQHDKVKVNDGVPDDDLPRLVHVSGRTKEAVQAALDDIIRRSLDCEYVRLFHEIFSKPLASECYRGFSIVSKSGEISRSTRKYFKRQKIAFIFDMFDDNVATDIQQLLHINVFRQTLEKINTIVKKTCSIDILDVIQSQEVANLSHKYLLNISMHIGLLEIFQALQISPDFHAGSFIGELICAYYEQILSLEQIVSIALCISEEPLKDDNKSESYFTMAQRLSKLIPYKPVESKRWKHHDKEDRHHTELSTLLIKSLLYQRDDINLKSIFPNSTVIVNFGLTQNCANKKENHFDVLHYKDMTALNALLYNLGRLYQYGVNAKLDQLYPEIKWPVSRATPMISPLLKWDYSTDLFVVHSKSFGSTRKFDRYVINEKYNDWSYISGHNINGKNLFPAAGYLYLVMESFAKLHWTTISQLNICFENVKFTRASYVPAKTSISFDVVIEYDGYFYLADKDGLVVCGRVLEVENPEDELLDIRSQDDNLLPLTAKDIYKELRLRGYNYRGAFRGIVECNNIASKGKVKWEDNWITFLDSLMQVQILQEDTRNLYVPTQIQKIVIFPDKHFASIEDNIVNIYVERDSRTIRSGGVQMQGVSCAAISKRKPLSDPVIESYQFIPNETTLTLEQSIRVNIQIILENHLQQEFKAFETYRNVESTDQKPLSFHIQKALEDQPLIQADIKLFSKVHYEYPGVTMSDRPINCEANLLLACGYNLLENAEALQEVVKALQPGGFIMTRENKTGGSRYTEYTHPNLTVFTKHETQDEIIILLRVQTPTPKNSSFFEIPNDVHDFDWIPKLQEELTQNPNITLISKSKYYNGILGFVNCLRREPGKSNLKCIFVMDESTFDPEDIYNKQHLDKSMSINVLCDSKWGTYRHILIDAATVTSVEQAFAVVAVPGDFSSLTWVEGPLTMNTDLQEDHILVYVYYASLNFRDILTASGRLPFDIGVKTRVNRLGFQGLEFAGIDSSGRRVVGMGQRGALSTIFSADKYMLWEVPDGWTLAEAATVPVVYCTVLYAFRTAGGLREGQTVLIHSGTGGVGQAAIHIALRHKCIVFTTAGTPEKRDFLIKHYPQINPDHIGNSRDTSFEEMIRKHTNGRGVDIVLNSLAEEKLFASLRCVARGGHMLEIGKFDLVNNNDLALYIFENQITIHGIMLDLVFEVDVRKIVQGMLDDAFQSGLIKPLHRTVFARDKIEDAFRFMASGKHIGKVMVNVRPDENEYVVPKQTFFECKARFYCNPDATYVIVGGLGGFGMELADWLVVKGCKKLVLVSRDGITTGYQDLRIRFWKKYIDSILISTADVTTEQGCSQLMTESRTLGPIEAIFNLAVVLKDGLFENLTTNDFEASFGPKAIATKHLDYTSRQLCPNLRHFVVFSSVSCGRGNPGQTNYGMSNSVMERICEQRKADGLPALVIQWGAVGDVGLVAEMNELNKDVVIGGTLQQSISSCIDLLDSFLCHDSTIISSMVVAEKRAGANVEEVICNILGIKDMKTINLQMTLPELGMDSITGVEIKQIIERDFDITLTAQEMKTMTFIKIRELSEKKEVPTEEVENTSSEQTDWLSLILRNMKETHLRDVPFVPLPTLSNPSENAAEVCFLPGIEGMCSILTPLTSMLNCKATGYQFLYRYPNDNIPAIAATIYDEMKKNPVKTINLVAYSYGCLVAIELIALFENDGRLVNGIFIDGAPAYFKKMFQKIFSIENDDYLKTTLLLNLISSNVSSEVSLEVKKNILKCSTFEKQLNTALESVPDHDFFSREYIEQSYYAIYDRLKALKQYESTLVKLKSKIKLFRPVNSDVADDYGLSNYFEQPVDVKIVDCDHLTILQNLEVANEVNLAAKL